MRRLIAHDKINNIKNSNRKMLSVTAMGSEEANN